MTDHFAGSDKKAEQATFETTTYSMPEGESSKIKGLMLGDTYFVDEEEVKKAEARVRAEERVRAFEILHKYALMTVKPESLSLIELAQEEILNPRENE